MRTCHTLGSVSFLYNLNKRALDTMVEKRQPTAAVVAMNLLLKLMNTAADPRDMESKPPFLISVL